MATFKQTLKCIFGFHDWGEWGPTVEGYPSKIIEKRECRVIGCNATRFNRIRSKQIE